MILAWSLAALGALTALAAPNEWTIVGSLDQARQNHTATLLPDGSVLVAGGDDGANARFASAVLWDPLTGAFTATGSMVYGRSGHTASLLADGRVLVAGGSGLLAGLPGTPAYLSSAEVWDPATGDWELLTDVMASARSGHTATVLFDGRVLVAGGRSGSLTYTASADIFDPDLGTFAPTGSLPSGRNDHSATLLTDGRVLVVGGFAGTSGTPPLPTYLATAAIYDPDLGTFAAVASITGSRGRHTATLLRNGRVLVAAGRAYSLVNGFYSRDTASTYDPVANSWSAAGTLSHARAGHGASLIANGWVLACGGGDAPTGNACEWYVEATNSWSWAPSLTVARTRHTMTVLPDGFVLAVGGMDDAGAVVAGADRWEAGMGQWAQGDDVAEYRDSQTATLLEDGTVLVAGGQGSSSSDVRDSCERYNPAADLWSSTGSMTEARTGHTATRLADGSVLVTGGFRPAPTYQMRTAELYDPDTGTWTATGSMGDRRHHHTATLLPDGRVLVAGGYWYDGASTFILASAEIYDPDTGIWSATGAMVHARRTHTATLLPDGRVLVTGGTNDSGYLAECELFDPTTGSWTTTGSMFFSRRWHTATLLPDGRVLVVGGSSAGVTYPTRTELYQPSAGVWSLGDDLGEGFSSHTATLLPDGRVLVAGGWDGWYRNRTLRFDPVDDAWSILLPMTTDRSSHTATLLLDGRILVACGSTGSTVTMASTELCNATLGAGQASRPVLFVISSELRTHEPKTFYGSGLLGGTEASSGTTQSSSSGFPMVQLRRLDNEQMTWLRPGPVQLFRDAEFRAEPLPDFPEGPTLVTVFANGVPSVSRSAVVASGVLFADGFESGDTDAWSDVVP